jgi:primosomal protein N'
LAGRPAIAAEIEAIELEIAHAKAAQGHQAAGVDELRAQVQALEFFVWEAATAEERRAIYSSVVDRVVIEGDEVVEVRVRGL